MRIYSISILLVTLLSLILVFLIHRRLLKRRTDNQNQFKNLKNKYKKYSYLSGTALFLSFGFLFYAFLYLSHYLFTQYFTNHLPQDALYAQNIYLYIPLALSLSGFFISFIAYFLDKIFLKNQYSEYMKYTKILYGKNLRYLGTIFSFFNLLLVLFFSSFLSAYLAIDNNKIYFKNPLSFQGKIFNYDQIESITYLPNHRFNQKFFIFKPTLKIKFKDGYFYDSSYSLYDSWKIGGFAEAITLRSQIKPLLQVE